MSGPASESTIVVQGGRTVGWAEWGDPSGSAILWCHGAPGSRFDPAPSDQVFQSAGLRVVAIDRPGYGLSDPDPGRTIEGWSSDAIAVLDNLNITDFVAFGYSTGGAYALALALVAPKRIRAVVATSGVSDVRDEACRACLEGYAAWSPWEAGSRAEALAVSEAIFGADGSNFMEGFVQWALPEADIALLSDPAFIDGLPQAFGAMFAHGVVGYTDDRLADRSGWTGFDVTDISCPTLVLHGALDPVVPLIHGRHTAEIVPGAELVVLANDGHFSMLRDAAPAMSDWLAAR